MGQLKQMEQQYHFKLAQQELLMKQQYMQHEMMRRQVHHQKQQQQKTYDLNTTISNHHEQQQLQQRKRNNYQHVAYTESQYYRSIRIQITRIIYNPELLITKQQSLEIYSSKKKPQQQ